MVNNSFSFLLFFIMCVFSSRPEEPAGLFFTFKSKNALFTFLPFYFYVAFQIIGKYLLFIN